MEGYCDKGKEVYTSSWQVLQSLSHSVPMCKKMGGVPTVNHHCLEHKNGKNSIGKCLGRLNIM